MATPRKRGVHELPVRRLSHSTVSLSTSNTCVNMVRNHEMAYRVGGYPMASMCTANWMMDASICHVYNRSPPKRDTIQLERVGE